MAKRDQSAPKRTKIAGRRTEELTSRRYPELSRNEEGRSTTLPFVFNPEQLSKYICLTEKSKREIQKVSQSFPIKIPEFYLNLIDKGNPACPLKRQSVPSKDEFVRTGQVDPLDEHRFLVTPSFLKKYPGRGVFLATSVCAMYCRFCNRRRLVGKDWDPRATWEESFSHMENDEDLKEVIISGGDPFTLPVEDFSYMLERISRVNRIKTVRISTRLPVVFPEGLKKRHLLAISKGSPPWVVVHINHPKEVSPEFSEVVRKLRKAGASMVSQTVLLRGVNDCPHILLRLFDLLVALGIKPYYLFQLDEVKGAMHFKVSLEAGIRIMHFLRKYGSGLAMPQYALDITGGLGKVPLDYQYSGKREGTLLHLEGLSGEHGCYADDGKKSRCQHCGICGWGKTEAKKLRS
jgi:lysine 2,3-aminomutase